MKRLLLLLLFIPCLAHAQWQPVGNSLQRTPDGKSYRINTGSGSFLYLYQKSQVDSLIARIAPAQTIIDLPIGSSDPVVLDNWQATYANMYGNHPTIKAQVYYTNSIATYSNLVGGSGYPNGRFTIHLTGGTGSGAFAMAVITGGVITSITAWSDNGGYTVGDVLTFSPDEIGGTGSGFSVKVASLGSVFFDYLTSPILIYDTTGTLLKSASLSDSAGDGITLDNL